MSGVANGVILPHYVLIVTYSRSLFYTFFVIVAAKRMWNSLFHPGQLALFFSHDLRDWFHFNLQTEVGLHSGADWKQTFGVGVWMLWSWRNRSVFTEHFTKPTAPDLLIHHLRRFFVIDGNHPTPENPTSPSHLCWHSPLDNWVKINVDGVVSSTANIASCGGK